jgi:RsiW-degrading membrane proteinase PrsW (M82 family)
MPFEVECVCGKAIRVRDELVGRRARCPGCGELMVLENKLAAPPKAVEPRISVTPKVTRAPEPPARLGTGRRERPALRSISRQWNRRYWFLALALIPLFFSLVGKDEDFETRLKRTKEKASAQVRQRLEELEEHGSKEQFLDAAPERRIDGALTAWNTKTHWFFAAGSAAAFCVLFVVLFGVKTEDLWPFIFVGLFTGTAGIFLLLAVQWIAFATSGTWVRGGGKLVILFLIIKLIGFSYSAALDPENGFVLSFVGFTAGVGLCEELCKALPLMWHVRNSSTLDWRGLCLWGLASGIGFGVSEGVTYSSDYYNGISTGGIYVVRFVSCVALHAFWAAAIGIVLSRRRQTVQGDLNFFELALPTIQILAVPMVLHGLYDTLLKRDHGFLACLVALVSFAWLAWQIEQERSTDAPEAATVAA